MDPPVNCSKSAKMRAVYRRSALGLQVDRAGCIGNLALQSGLHTLCPRDKTMCRFLSGMKTLALSFRTNNRLPKMVLFGRICPQDPLD